MTTNDLTTSAVGDTDHSGKPASAVVMVTPEMAERWLGRNHSNRNVRRALVDAYARDMAAGRWTFNGEPIQFATDGTMVNGQHRLHAIVQAKVTLPMLVVRNLPVEAARTMDGGAKRTPGDQLSMTGYANSRILASTARLIIQLRDSADGTASNRKVSTAEILELADADDSLAWVCADVLRAYPIGVASPTVLAYCYWRLRRVDAVQCDEFFTAFAELTNLPAGSPIAALHKRLSAHTRKGDGQAYRTMAISYIFRAWNAWRKGERRSKLQMPSGRASIPEPK